MFSFGILPLLLKSGLFYTNSSWRQSNDIIEDCCGHVRSIGERFVIIGHLCLSARGCCRALTMMVTHKVHSLNHCWMTMTTTTVTIEKTFVYIECSPSGADVNRWIPASERFSCRSTPATRSTSLASRSVLFNARHWLWITYLRDIVTNVISFNSNRRRDRIGDSYRFQKCMCGDRLRVFSHRSFDEGVIAFVRRCRRMRDIRSISTDLSAGRKATDAFLRRFGASMPRGREIRRRHAIRSIPRPRSVTWWHVMPRFYSTFTVPSYSGLLFRGHFHYTSRSYASSEGKKRSFSQ